MGDSYKAEGNRANARKIGKKIKFTEPLAMTKSEDEAYYRFMAKRGITKKMLQHTL